MIEMPSAGSTIGSRGLEAPVLRESLLKQTPQPQSAIAATARYLARSEGEADQEVGTAWPLSWAWITRNFPIWYAPTVPLVSSAH